MEVKKTKGKAEIVIVLDPVDVININSGIGDTRYIKYQGRVLAVGLSAPAPTRVRPWYKFW